MDEMQMRVIVKRFSPKNFLNILLIIFIISVCYTIFQNLSKDSTKLFPRKEPLHPGELNPGEEPQQVSLYERATQDSRMIRSSAEDPKLVLLVSTLGRSGSSWIGELLSTRRRSFYIYEPDYYTVIVRNKTMNNDEGVESVKSQFLCDFQEDFVTFEKSNRTAATTFRSLYTKFCKNKDICLDLQNLKTNCKKSTYRIIKTIRLSVEYVGSLLRDSSLKDLKVVYIVRDPRAAQSSRERLGWMCEPQKYCKALEEDLRWYKALKRRFFRRIHLLRYEDLCKNVSGEGTRLWQFLSDDLTAQMPSSWARFFIRHSEAPTKENPYEVTRDHTTEWLNWRNELKDETFLNTIENLCENSLKEFGYNIFGSLNNLKNFSISSLSSVDKCPNIPCHVNTILKDDI